MRDLASRVTRLENVLRPGCVCGVRILAFHDRFTHPSAEALAAFKAGTHWDCGVHGPSRTGLTITVSPSYLGAKGH